jgi:single-strand DNA-binding protein
MSTINTNRTVLTGNLTRAPDVRETSSGSKVGRMRIAVNGRRKNTASGEWEDKANFFDVTVFGQQAENCARYLSKGSRVAIDGRLEHEEWTQDDTRRERVVVIAENVEFLSARRNDSGEPESSSTPEAAEAAS